MTEIFEARAGVAAESHNNSIDTTSYASPYFDFMAGAMFGRAETLREVCEWLHAEGRYASDLADIIESKFK